MPPTIPKFTVRLPGFQPPFSIGTDICSIGRIKRILQEPKWGRKFANRILSPHEPRPAAVGLDHTSPLSAELLQYHHHSNNNNSNSNNNNNNNNNNNSDSSGALHRAATFLAGRFAAKEAVFKAHPAKQLTFHDVLVVPFRQSGSHVEVEMWAKPSTGGKYDGDMMREHEKKEEEHVEQDCNEDEMGAGKRDMNSIGETLHQSTTDTAQHDWAGFFDHIESGRPQINAKSELERYVSGPPIALIHGSPAAQISISHDGEYAVATCMAYHQHLSASPSPFKGLNNKRQGVVQSKPEEP